MFIATLFAGAKTWNQSTCAPTDEQTGNVARVSGRMFAVVKKNEITTLAEIWIGLQLIVSKEISLAQEDK